MNVASPVLDLIRRHLMLESCLSSISAWISVTVLFTARMATKSDGCLRRDDGCLDNLLVRRETCCFQKGFETMADTDIAGKILIMCLNDIISRRNDTCDDVLQKALGDMLQ